MAFQRIHGDDGVPNPLVAHGALVVAPDVPFAVASADSNPERVGGKVLAGALSAGKRTTERRVREVLTQLIEESSG